MREGEPAQDPLGARGELDHHLPAIAGTAPPAHETVRGEAVEKPHGTVVAQPEAPRELSHAHRLRAGVTLDREQRLMVLRGETGAARGLFAEGEEAPQQEAELCQKLVIGLGEGARGW
ncbi:MAG TPA: hypothetical protein VMU67_10915 [Steroidobacteraceae bacterium]|nr:hypothetical protein [Steroidobacteraceae bacterium]